MGTDKLVEDVAKAICCRDGCTSPERCFAITDPVSMAEAERVLAATGITEMREALEKLTTQADRAQLNAHEHVSWSAIHDAKKVLSNTHEPEKVETDG